MIVLPNKQHIVFNTPTLESLGGVIPHARTFEYGGEQWTAVPHKVEETHVLRNLGMSSAPAPILHYYDWPSRFEAMEHQKQTSAFFVLNRKALCLNAPGTGKSMSALWAADYLMREGIIQKCLIVAPLSTLKSVWGKEIMRHMPHLDFKIIVGSKKKRIELLNSPGLQVAIINHDGLGVVPDSDLSQFGLVIYDECTALKSPTSKRFREFFTFMKTYNPWLWMMTGTPIAQSPTDGWTLAKLVGSKNLPRSFTAFKDMTMRKVTQFKWVPREDALDVCKRVLQPSIRYDLSECKDLPETTLVHREAAMSKAQLKAFKELKTAAMIEGENISAANAAVLFQKLLQVGCGVAYDSEGNNVHFDDKGRVDTLLGILDEIQDKTIVYVPLRGVQERLAEVLQKKGYDVAVVNGSVGREQRYQIFNDFQETDKIDVLLAHPKVASHGLTLTRSKNIVWYAPIYSLEAYEQANARIRRLTTQGKTVVYHVYATYFERELYRRLETKRRVLSDFLSLVSGVNE